MVNQFLPLMVKININHTNPYREKARKDFLSYEDVLDKTRTSNRYLSTFPHKTLGKFLISVFH